MKLKLHNRKVTFKYGTLESNQLTTLDIKQWYQNLGGKIDPSTKVEFFSYFPGRPYEKTTLTSKMPPNYLCEGSVWLNFCQPNGQIDVLALSVYRDTKGGQKYKGKPIGDHRNLFLQYEIGDKKTHIDEIPNRHIPLEDGVIIKAIVDDIEVKKITIEPHS